MCVSLGTDRLHRTRSRNVQRSRSDDKGGIKRDVGDRRVSRRRAAAKGLSAAPGPDGDEPETPSL